MNRRFWKIAGAPLCASLLGLAACVGAQENKSAAKPAMPSVVADGAQLQAVYEADRFFEGPVWEPKTNRLFFTAHPGGGQPSQILRLQEDGKAEVWLNETQGINGMTLGRDGRLLGAQGRAKPPAIVAISTVDKKMEVVAQASDENPMVETNDLDEDAKGGIYFSSPDFGQKTRSAVFYRSPEGKITRVISNLKLPNGLEVSNDGKTLVVSDSFEKRVYAYPIKDDGTLEAGRVRIFFDPDTPSQSDPDGITTDEDGNFYFTMRGGVWVASPQGENLGMIPVKEFVSNVSFGGADGRTLFLTGSGKVYSLRMKSRGVGWK
jgi:gluconolactonase